MQFQAFGFTLKAAAAAAAGRVVRKQTSFFGVTWYLRVLFQSAIWILRKLKICLLMDLVYRIEAAQSQFRLGAV